MTRNTSRLSAPIVDHDAEMELLVCLLDMVGTDTPGLRAAVARLSPSMFTVTNAADVFEAIATASARPTVSIGDVLVALRTRGAAVGVDAENDPARLLMVDIIDKRHGTAGQVSHYLDAVVTADAKRHAIAVGNELVALAHRGRVTPLDVAAVESHLDALRMRSGTRSGVIWFEDALDAWEAEDESADIVPTGFMPFDYATDGGLPLGGVVGFTAPPGVGKSAFALQIVMGALLHNPGLTAVWGMGEMTPSVLVRRALCVVARMRGWPTVTMRNAKRRDAVARDAKESARVAMVRRLAIVPAPLTVASMERMVVEANAKILVVDYLQLVRADGISRIEQIESVMADLKTLAVRHRVAVIAISNMAKASIKSPSTAGTICKGSSELDYAFDFLFQGEPSEREERTTESFGDPPPVEIKWVCHKARNEDKRSIVTLFDGTTQHYTSAPTIDDFDAFKPGGDTWNP